MKTEHSQSLTTAQQAELDALAALPDDKINTLEMPEVRDWSGARRGLFFRPVKKQLTLRLDANLIAWFKGHAAQGQGYQTIIINGFARVCYAPRPPTVSVFSPCVACRPSPDLCPRAPQSSIFGT